MMALDDIGARITALQSGSGKPGEVAAEALALGEAVLENWVAAHGGTPTADRREGFRLLALHRQGAKGDPSFNACRETCRELVYRANVIQSDPDGAGTAHEMRLAVMVLFHLYLFIAGKLEQSGLGEFCCSSRPLHGAAAQR